MNRKTLLIFLGAVAVVGAYYSKPSLFRLSKKTSAKARSISSDEPATLAGPKCVDCHTGVMSRKIKHDGADGSCDMCHAPHETATDHPFRLTDNVNNLCAQCHDGYDKKNHPVADHPVVGAKDPIHPEREFTCVSCHNPHSSDAQHLFQYHFSDKTPYGGNSCLLCHFSPPGIPESATVEPVFHRSELAAPAPAPTPALAPNPPAPSN